MGTKIEAGHADDPKFIELLNSVVRGVLLRSAPKELFVVQIDNWFDHKWLGFSGYGSVHFQFPAIMRRQDAAKHAFHQKNVTFPPFTPMRIVSQRHFGRVSGHYSETSTRRWPHSMQRQRSKLNLQKRIADVYSSACFVWYSSNSLTNGKASIMVYTAISGEVETWFAAFNRDDDWKVKMAKGESKGHVQDLLNTV